MSPGHDLSQYCHLHSLQGGSTSVTRHGCLHSQSSQQWKHENIMGSWGEGVGGGQFGKFHFSAMTVQFRSFSKINLIRKWSPTVGSFQIKCLLSLQADDEIFFIYIILLPKKLCETQSLIWVICSVSNCRYLSFPKLHILGSFYWRFKDVLRTESC